MIKKIFEQIKILLLNLIVGMLSIIWKRDDSVWLFGSWMGLRFADNSRFLFQYLHNNKELLDIKRVIWVSKDRKIIDELRMAGYECYYTNSLKSIYWHLRAGVHVICNMYYKNNHGFDGDINGLLSARAKKLQLWHGVGIKACGKMIPKGTMYEQHNAFLAKLSKTRIMNSPIMSPGCWKNRYHLVTSDENARVAVLDYDVNKNRLIYANYPRENDDQILLPNEKNEINQLLLYLKGKTGILYCPTFRQTSSDVNSPCNDESFLQFLRQNKMLWIEKRHFASTVSGYKENDQNIFFISADFDINLLYKYTDILITDYSSASSDFIYREKKVISYIPDFDFYKNKERGFVNNYEKYYPGMIANTLSELKEAIVETNKDTYFLENNRIQEYLKCKKFLFDDSPSDLGWIFSNIRKQLFQ